MTLLAWSLPASGQQVKSTPIDSLKNALSVATADTSRIALLNIIGNQYSGTNPDEGIRYASQALSLATAKNWEKGIANAYNVLGICYYLKSDNHKAMQHWDKALKLFVQTDDKKGVLKVVGNIGVVNSSEGAYAKALDNFFQALKYSEELNDQHSIAINLGNIGSVYEYMKDYQKALEYDRKAIEMSTRMGNKPGIAVLLGNTGNVYLDLKDYPAAVRCIDSALSLDRQLGNQEGEARDLVNLGSVYEGAQDYNRAFGYYFLSRSLAEKIGVKVTESNALGKLGEALLSLVEDSSTTNGKVLKPLPGSGWSIPTGKNAMLSAAINYLKESIRIDTAISNLDHLQHTYNSLSAAQAIAGDYMAALESHKQYVRYKDSVLSAGTRIKITNLETQRELDLKDKQIIIDKLAVEKKRNERVLFGAGFVLLLIVVIIVVRNIRLSTAKELSENKLNAFQARMNPHFIFNSLSSIQSLIMNNDMESSIDYLSEFSTLMRQVLDNSALSKVPLKTEIDMLRSYIELEHLRFDGFSRNITIADDIAEEKIEVPGMIIQPFVENAILHGLVSKGAEGRLDVAFTRTDKHIICTVEDNGVGRERSAEINKRRSKSRQSHGTAIATNRLTLLNDKKKGLVNKVTYIDKKEDGIPTGTKVVIELPIL